MGTVSIHADLLALTARRARYIGIVTVVLLASLVAAWAMSWLSQRTISTPIVELAGVARTVSLEKDYSKRAEVAGNASEVAILITAFHDMLTEIQQRNESLGRAQEELEERVRQRTAELAAANQELEAFSYSVSHDLRAPLRHVTGFADILEEHAGARLDDEGRRYLRTITDAAKRMGQLIDDLLAFSRVGRSPLIKRPVSLNDVVREARQEVAGEPGAAGRDVRWHVAVLPDVEGDAAMLRLVMINLLSNAMKYSSTRHQARIEVGAEVGTEGEPVVFVRDNGVGFDMRYAHKLFGVFQRLHRSSDFEGTGIGLASVKRIIQRHGGRVWVESQVDGGATFYFSLPNRGP